MNLTHYLPRALRFSQKPDAIQPPRPEDEAYMRLCLALALEALEAGEIPVGAVVVQNGTVVAQARNRREECRNALLHAETAAIEQACRALGAWRLTDCTLYVTLEPCVMCGGAAFNARIPRIVYGAGNPDNGSLGGVLNLNRYPLSHSVTVTPHVMEAECRELLNRFFRDKR